MGRGGSNHQPAVLLLFFLNLDFLFLFTEDIFFSKELVSFFHFNFLISVKISVIRKRAPKLHTDKKIKSEKNY